MNHLETLQTLLDHYKKGLMTTEEYNRFVAAENRQEMIKRDIAEVERQAERYYR